MRLKLSLPQPSEELISTCLKLATISSMRDACKLKWFTDINSNSNSTAHQFQTNDTLIKLALKEYQEFFPTEILTPTSIIFSNITSKVASYPPHSDLNRYVALNFYLNAGGENVTTVFYDKHDGYEINGGKLHPYTDLKIDSVYKFDINTWYALSVRQVHSVENITNDRIMFALGFYEPITWPEFVKKYSHLVISD